MIIDKDLNKFAIESRDDTASFKVPLKSVKLFQRISEKIWNVNECIKTRSTMP